MIHRGRSRPLRGSLSPLRGLRGKAAKSPLRAPRRAALHLLALCPIALPHRPACVRARHVPLHARVAEAGYPDYNAGMALMNLDAGEHDDEPEELWAKFDVLNIACGGHAGDAASMERV